MKGLSILICGLDVKTVTLKQVTKVISKNTNNINTKEWFITNVTNAVTNHLKSQILTNTCKKGYIKIMEKNPTNATIVVSQQPLGLTCGFT